jgi:hypothetical protein
MSGVGLFLQLGGAILVLSMSSTWKWARWIIIFSAATYIVLFVWYKLGFLLTSSPSSPGQIGGLLQRSSPTLNEYGEMVFEIAHQTAFYLIEIIVCLWPGLGRRMPVDSRGFPVAVKVAASSA